MTKETENKKLATSGEETPNREDLLKSWSALIGKVGEPKFESEILPKLSEGAKECYAWVKPQLQLGEKKG